MKTLASTTSSALNAFAFPLALVVGMAALHLLSNFGLAGSMDAWANQPRNLGHLSGIVTSHLRHGSWAHWLANAVPLVVLAGMAGALMPKATARTWLFMPVVAGLLLWLWGRHASHLGASALVYGWFFFLMGMGVLRRSFLALVGMAIALLLFSGLLWVLHAPAGVSWEGHLAGAIAGLWSAHLFRRADTA